MKYALLVYDLSEFTDAVNIGDYIQSIAARQYLPSVDKYIEREYSDRDLEDEYKCILNGYFMHGTHFPPNDKITPLFISFHINSLAKNAILKDEGVAYLKKHEPIGCRDYDTVNLLKEKNIDAYFSGCLTLTLGNKYATNEQSGKYYFVEPYCSINKYSPLNVLKNFYTMIIRHKTIKTIAQKYYNNKRVSLIKTIKIAAFFREYSKIIDTDIILNAEYITQQNTEIPKRYSTDDDKLKYAEELINKYARAKFVVTSRIHCALPCLGLGTPVLFTENLQQPESSYCRLKGLREFFNVAVWDNKKEKLLLHFETNGKITENNIPQNKTSYEKYAEELSAKCKTFVNQLL